MLKHGKKESKFKKLGRINGKLYSFWLSSLLNSENKRTFYKRFINELSKYSFRYHRQDEERHEGCRSWVEETSETSFSRFNIPSPKEYAMIVKANMDALQQKKHARNYHAGFLEGFYLK